LPFFLGCAYGALPSEEGELPEEPALGEAWQATVTAPTTPCPASSGTRVWPVSGSTTATAEDVIQDVYGPIIRGGSYDMHGGVDFRAPLGTPVHAITDGFVTRKYTWQNMPGEPYGGSGNWIMIQHHDAIQGKTIYSRYMHLNSFGTFQEGDCVKAGDVIGHVGQTGTNANTVHLHMGLLANLTAARAPKADETDTLNPWLVLPEKPSGAVGYTGSTGQLLPDGRVKFRVNVEAKYANIGKITFVRTIYQNYCFSADPLCPFCPLECVQYTTYKTTRTLEFTGTGVIACGDATQTCAGVHIAPVDFDPGTYNNPSDPGDFYHSWDFTVPRATTTAGDELYRVVDVDGLVMLSRSLD
jgi:murein DD-endopeptidase MepM/ murein hydrolase activator NlpD